MTVDKGVPPVVASSPVDIASRDPAPLEHTDPAGPPDPPDPPSPADPPDPRPPGSPEEVVAVRDLVARLRATWPTVDEAAVEAVVRSAYDSFRQARVRAYIPILVERRARRTLGEAAGDRVARSAQPPPGEELISDVGRRSRAHRRFHRAARGTTGLEGPAGPGLPPS
ncbi:three-helix bundle dimerization domain-containing protein [Streptomyces sp. NPDC052127]|uniref:three-helix bundle dimerization domain-containing protein n=1 Tax=Streptomyces sp. NPDC052127 TaxID=3155679 RepID=UPI003432CA8C